ncbi:hypothetical protein ACETRX_34455 [Labrys portucalensis]|uniref:HEPN domain-containing protein n=2 Tax=Labrys neptuniae TaxID=376174 RepID=A0ABV6ZRE1_9HYPH
MFSSPPPGPMPQEYLRLARMFKDTAIFLPEYIGNEQNWPAYALLLHACELAVKAFCAKSVENGHPADKAKNHDLRGWYEIALRYGFPAHQSTKAAIDILTDLHAVHYTRYPDNRKGPVPDLSFAKQTAEDLISAANQLIHPH